MSEVHQETAHPPAEEDLVPTRKILLVGVTALVVFFMGSLAAAWGMNLVQRRANPDGPPPTPTAAGEAKIGLVEQRLFENANQGVVWHEWAERRLSSYGWVDRRQGIVHIPIGRAMDLLEKGARP